MTAKAGGLKDVIAGKTAISTVSSEDRNLSYRGYDIATLAEKATFEEVAYLLLYGKLPNAFELRSYQEKLQKDRVLPRPLREVLEILPPQAHPMSVVRTGISVLGSLEKEQDFDEQYAIADRLVAVTPSIILYWYRFHKDKIRINTKTRELSLAGHFLRLLTDKPPKPLHQRALDASLILYAEHEFNSSTFSARVTASTLTDFYSAIIAAVGTLRGPLHGGANERAYTLIQRFQTPQEAETGIKEDLANQEIIMGFGHRVYKQGDPRSPIIKALAKELADETGNQQLISVCEKIEEVMLQEKGLYPNVDFYSAPAYALIGIPVSLYTPLFVCARLAGWSAHIFEQRANNRLIRPRAEYIGNKDVAFTPIDKRK